MRLRRLAALALAFAACAPVPRRVSTSNELDARGFSGSYASGLRVVTFQSPTPRRCGVVVSYDAGTVDDPPGREGLSRLVAELTMRSAGTVGGLMLAERAFAAGAASGADVHRTETVFSTLAKPTQLGAVLAIEADRMRDPLAGVGERDFEAARESQARKLERGDAAEGQDAAAGWLADAALGAGARRATPASVRAATLEDARAWARTHLVPSRAVVVVSSGAAPADTARRVRDVFGPLASPPGGAVTPPFERPTELHRADPAPSGSGALLIRAGPVEKPIVWVGWTWPDDGSAAVERDAALMALRWTARDAISKASLASRTTEVGARAVDRPNGTLVAVGFWVDDEQTAARVADAVSRAPRDQGNWAQRVGVALSSATASDRTRTIRLFEEGVVPDAAGHLRGTGDANVFAALGRPPLDALEGIAAKWRDRFTPERAVALLAMPGEAAREAPAPPKQDVWLARVSTIGAAAPGPDAVPLLLDGPGIATSERLTLANGLQLVLLRRPEFPTVEARLVVRTDPAFSETTMRTALDAARKSFGWNRAFDACFRSSLADAARGHLIFEESVSAQWLGSALERLSCRTQRDALDGEILALARKAGTDARERGLAKPATRALLLALDAALPGEAWAPRAFAEEPSALDADDAARFLDEGLRPDRALLVLSGRLPPTMELRDEVAQRFAAWRQRPGSPDVAAATAPAPERRRTILVDAARPGSPPPATAAVFIVVRLAAIASGDDAAESALVGYLSVRIAAALGEGAEVLVTRGDLATGTPLLLVRGRFETSRVPEAIRRITEELARVAQAPLPDTATNLARWVAAISAAYRFDTNAGAADAAALLFAAKLPLDAWDRLPASIAALDAARIWAAARGSSIGREAIGVSGDAAAIEPMLRAAGLDPERAPSP